MLIVANPLMRYGAKLCLVASRSVNSLVWALLLVAVFGPVEAMAAVGAPWPSVFLKGYWPQVKPAFLSIVLLHWDINVRGPAVLALLGAGGIRPVLDTAIVVFQGRAAAAVLVAVFAVVLFV